MLEDPLDHVLWDDGVERGGLAASLGLHVPMTATVVAQIVDGG